MKKILISAIIMLALLAGCNLPGVQSIQPSSPPSSPNDVFTQAAQTVSAQLTQMAQVQITQLASITPAIPTNTFTPVPSNTTVYTPSITPIPCNWAGFIADVTIPDNTPVAIGQTFTKIWRLRNIGTCTWSNAYTVAFMNGDGMGVSTGYSQALTSVPIPPGGTVDISVNLTAPSSNGTYTGNWSIREPGGQTFGTNFIVKIKVFTAVAVTLVPVPGESGTVRSDAGPFPDFTAGESNADITRTCEFFLSYDISGLPSNATILEVKFNLTNYSVTGNPFGLGVLKAYVVNYGATLEISDFVSTDQPGNIADWGSTSALNNIEASPEMKTALQSKIGSGRLQLRLQFPGSNGDAVKDRITFTNPVLLVTYTTP